MILVMDIYASIVLCFNCDLDPLLYSGTVPSPSELTINMGHRDIPGPFWPGHNQHDQNLTHNDGMQQRMHFGKLTFSFFVCYYYYLLEIESGSMRS